MAVLTETNEHLKVCLEAIDSPEKKRPFGARSREALSAVVAGKQVIVDVTGKDRYRPTLGWLILEGKNINRRMTADGWAWQFIRYNKYPSISLKRQRRRFVVVCGSMKQLPFRLGNFVN